MTSFFLEAGDGMGGCTLISLDRNLRKRPFRAPFRTLVTLQTKGGPFSMFNL